jgi:hypothetical protein
MNDELPTINSEEEFNALDEETKEKLRKKPAGSEGGVYEINPTFGDANA